MPYYTVMFSKPFGVHWLDRVGHFLFQLGKFLSALCSVLLLQTTNILTGYEHFSNKVAVINVYVFEIFVFNTKKRFFWLQTHKRGVKGSLRCTYNNFKLADIFGYGLYLCRYFINCLYQCVDVNFVGRYLVTMHKIKNAHQWKRNYSPLFFSFWSGLTRHID